MKENVLAAIVDCAIAAGALVVTAPKHLLDIPAGNYFTYPQFLLGGGDMTGAGLTARQHQQHHNQRGRTPRHRKSPASPVYAFLLQAPALLLTCQPIAGGTQDFRCGAMTCRHCATEWRPSGTARPRSPLPSRPHWGRSSTSGAGAAVPPPSREGERDTGVSLFFKRRWPGGRDGAFRRTRSGRSRGLVGRRTEWYATEETE